MIRLTDREFEEFVNYVYNNYGINLRKKKSLIEGRLQSVLTEKGFRKFCDYYQYIKEDLSGKGISEFIDKITTNYTFFYREKEHFKYFNDHVLPILSEKEKNSRDLRIWSAGCSTGEEAYTLAMIISDYFKDKIKFWDTEILATDISTEALDKAVKGIYENEQLKHILSNWRLNYFKSVDSERSEVSYKIRKEVIFRRFNLMKNIYPFKKKFHVIFCRNVMIYFDLETKKKLVNKLYNYLEHGGFLFIGHSESLNFNNRFKYVIPSVYRKD